MSITSGPSLLLSREAGLGLLQAKYVVHWVLHFRAESRVCAQTIMKCGTAGLATGDW